MADIAYIVLSDLHFGAANSLLSRLADGDPDQVRDVDVGRPSPVLSGLIAGLRSLAAINRDRQPTLVLAGDVLDLALSTDNVAASVFELFAREAFDSSAGSAFANEVIYVPGNHDHHLWETAREGQYVNYLKSLPAGAPLPPPWHSTRMREARDPRPVDSPMLATLLSRAGAAGVGVRVVYPNLAFGSGPDTAVVIHHGHYTESLYVLMSRVKDLLFPEQRQHGLPHVWEWEAENFSWIDFFWGTLGRSGDVGEDVGLVYAQLASRKCVDHYAKNVIRGLVGSERVPHWLKDAETTVLAKVADLVIDHMSTLERASPVGPLTEAGWVGLDNYLSGPVLDQVGREFGTVPDRLSFVFGHTHKPFEARRPVGGFAQPLDIYNTGGWVVDAPIPSPAHGGAAVLISSDLDVASLRVFNQTVDQKPSAMTINGNSPWAEELRSQVRLDAEPWASLAATVAQAAAERHRLSAAYQREC